MELLLKRIYHPKGTNGTLFLNQVPICHTIELPWRYNARGRSCIPEGSYPLTQRYSPRHHAHLLVNNVPERELILFHPFNHALKESRGCIAPVEKLTGTGTGFGSRRALEKLLKVVRGADSEVVLRVMGDG